MVKFRKRSQALNSVSNLLISQAGWLREDCYLIYRLLYNQNKYYEDDD